MGETGRTRPSGLHPGVRDGTQFDLRVIVRERFEHDETVPGELSGKKFLQPYGLLHAGGRAGSPDGANEGNVFYYKTYALTSECTPQVAREGAFRRLRNSFEEYSSHQGSTQARTSGPETSGSHIAVRP